MRIKFYKWSTLLLAMLMVFMLTPQVFAAEETLASKKVRIAAPSPEVLSQSETYGNTNGYTFEYLQAAGQYANWEIEVVFSECKDLNSALSDCINMVETGKADLVGAMLKNNKLEEKFVYPRNNYGIAHTVLLTLKNNPNVYENNLLAKENLKVAVLENASSRNQETRNYLDSYGVGYTFLPCHSTEEQVELLKTGQADVMVGIDLVPVPETRKVAFFAARPMYMAAAKGQEELIAQLDTAIDQLNQVDHTFQTKLFKKYFTTGSKSFSLTKEQQEYVASRKPVKVLFQVEAPPFQYTDSKGNIAGLSVMLLKDVANMTGLQFEFVTPKSGVSVQEALRSGVCDVLMAMPFNYDLSKEYGVISAQRLTDSYLAKIVHKGSESKPSEDWVVALPKGSIAKPDFAPKEVRTYPTIKDCMDAVEHGEADCSYVNNLTFSYYTEQHPYWNVTLESMLPTLIPYSFAFNTPLDLELATIVNSALRSMDMSNIYAYMSDIVASDATNTLWGTFQQNPIRIGSTFFAMILLLIVSVGLCIAYRFSHKKNIALNKAYGAKSDFLSHMSHEIRTPLNAIMGFSDLGLKESKDPDVFEYLSNIQMSGKYLLGMMNDILDMTKIEKSRIVLYPETVDFKQFIQDIEILLKDAVERKNIEFSMVCKNTQISYAVFDRLRVQQILVNLLSNAMKYSHQGGKVICTIENISKEKETILLKMIVKDYGVGMTAAFLNHLFEPFSQEKNEYSSSLNSCGLGLSIAKNLVDQMNGSVEVEARLDKEVNLPLLYLLKWL